MGKRFLIVILLFWSNVVTYSQNVTEEQRGKALSMASQFCNLLVQYSSFGDQYINNDAKIFNLCTSQNITVYNDLDGDKEDLLVSYLFTILGEYDNKLNMTFTPPKIEQSFGVPLFDIKTSITGGFSCDVVDYSDIYIVINTKQTIGALNKEIERKIIYSCNENKIIAFITKESPFILLQKAFKAFSVKDYESVFLFVDKVLSHKRFDHLAKNDAVTVAFLSAVLSDNLERIKKYGTQTNAALYNYMIGVMYANHNKHKESLTYFEMAASAGYEHAYYVLGLGYAVSDTDFRDVKKATVYLEKGMNSKDKDVISASSYYYGIMGLNFPDDFPLSDNQIVAYFQKAADNRFEPSFLPLSIMYEKIGEKDAAAIWDEKAANAGSNIGKARLGLYLLSSSDMNLHSEGLRCLHEAAYADIDAELDQFITNTGLEPVFPKSKNQVEQLIKKAKQ